MKTKIVTWIGMALATFAWAGTPVAWAATAAETQAEMNGGETILSTLRMFLRAIKDNVTELGETEFKFNGGNGLETRKAVAEESASSFTLNEAIYPTTHKLTISQDNGAVEVIAILGTYGDAFVGEIAVYMGSASAQITVKYLLPSDTNVGAQIEVATADGWTFEREKSGVVECTDPNGGKATVNSGMTCTFPGQLSDEDIRTIQSRVDAGESFQTVVASYGGTCS